MSLSFCVDKTVLGTNRHLVHDDGSITWCDSIPSDIWILSRRPRRERCLLTLLRLNGHELEPSVPDRYVASMVAAMKAEYSYERVPWQKVLPAQAFRLFLTGLVQSVLRFTATVDKGYYLETFSRVTPLFDAMDHAAINVPRLESLITDPKTVNVPTLRTFKPVAGSFARRVEYDRFGARTGRLTTHAGPDMLTLKKEYRNIVTSCFPGGAVRYVDFASLEARVLLTVAGQQVTTRDIYTDICRKLLPAKSRKVMKLIVLATVFGSGHAELQRLAGLSEKKMTDIQAQIREMFGVEQLALRLRQEWVLRGGKIKNAYGRLIVVPDEATLVNSYVQSTGVDVALLGFTWLIESMKQKNLQSRPVFILHDAIIIDTHPDDIDVIDKMVESGVKVPGMSNPFYLDTSALYTQE